MSNNEFADLGIDLSDEELALLDFSKSPYPVLQVRNLSKYFPIYSKGFFKKQIGLVKACDNINFDLMPDETLGLVGESGCGKTTTGRTILRAINPTDGKVIFNRGGNGNLIDLAAVPPNRLKPLRKDMQMIFQDPFSSLNPRMTVRDIVAEPMIIHKMYKGAELEDRVVEILKKVGLKSEHRMRYPHAFSGGQRQRIGIARALIMEPSLVVSDEAVSALDVSVQAQVINLMKKLQKDLGLTFIFIAHDLSVVKHICDRVAVMYAGQLVEVATTEQLFEDPKHPYTKALLSAVPNPDPDKKMNFGLKGEVADPGNLPKGCAFNPRCQLCTNGCKEAIPKLVTLEDGRQVSCFEFSDSKVAIKGKTS